MKKNTIDNLKVAGGILLLAIVAASLFIVFATDPVIQPDQIANFKEWALNR